YVIIFYLVNTFTSLISTLSLHDALPISFTLVVLDPGHGGQDSGAMCGAIYEKDLTFDIAQRVDRLLQAQGLATLMTRVGESQIRSEEHTSELQSRENLVCRLLLEKKKNS